MHDEKKITKEILFKLEKLKMEEVSVSKEAKKVMNPQRQFRSMHQDLETVRFRLSWIKYAASVPRYIWIYAP